MGFGELVRVVPPYPGRVGLQFRPDRQLYEVRMGKSAIDHGQLRWMHHVFRIVEDHGAVASPVAPLVRTQGRVDAIEAVGLGRRSGCVADDDPHPRIVSRRLRSRGYCRGIVAVAAEVDGEIILPPCRKRMRDGVPDHRRLIPSGDEHCGTPFQRSHGCLPGDPLVPASPSQPQPDPAQVHGEIVDGAQDEPERGEQQQFVLGHLKPGDGILKHRRRLHLPPFPHMSKRAGPRIPATPCGSGLWSG